MGTHRYAVDAAGAPYSNDALQSSHDQQALFCVIVEAPCASIEDLFILIQSNT